MPTQCNIKPLEFEAHDRRVAAEVGVRPQSPDLRFVVTSQSACDYPTRSLYEQIYCCCGVL